MDINIDPDHFYTFKKGPVRECTSVTANPSSSVLKESKLYTFLVVGQKMSSLHWKVGSVFTIDLTNHVTYKFNLGYNFIILSWPTI